MEMNGFCSTGLNHLVKHDQKINSFKKMDYYKDKLTQGLKLDDLK